MLLKSILVRARLTMFISQIRSPTGSKDLQMVNIGLRVLSRPDPAHLQKIYRTLGQNWEERVLPSICNEVMNFSY